MDSSTTAALLVEQGYHVIGMTMRLYTGFSTCCGIKDVDDARKVCDKLKIPFHVVSFEKEFSSRVMDTFVSEYLQGRTPNPCILCNQDLKFDHLLQEAKRQGADYIATGHYARIENDAQQGIFRLRKAVDITKDQSYFLFCMNQSTLSQTLFPLGEYTKVETRQLARKFNIPVHDKTESQDICFVPDGDYAAFVNQWMTVRKTLEEIPKPAPGMIVDTSGKVLGQHKGIHNYTVGQRSGLGIAVGVPVYVKQIDARNNRVVVGTLEEITSRQCIVSRFHWVSGCAPEGTIHAQVKIRYRHSGDEAEIKMVATDTAEMIFSTPQKAITPGQAAVVYDGEYVLGGGWIQ